MNLRTRLAVALAAQDTIKNLLGGLTVLADRPFQVGDAVVLRDAGPQQPRQPLGRGRVHADP